MDAEEEENIRLLHEAKDLYYAQRWDECIAAGTKLIHTSNLTLWIYMNTLCLLCQAHEDWYIGEASFIPNQDVETLIDKIRFIEGKPRRIIHNIAIVT